MDVIEQIFCNFWNTGDYNVQNSYLSKLLSWGDCKVTKVMNRPSRKLRTIHYSVLVNGKKKTICRQAFFSVHGITEKRVRSVLGKQSVTATTRLECRGKDIPRNKISSERKALVKQHIESLATVSSHYSRAKSPFRKYLSPGSSVNGAFHAYVEWLKEKNSNEVPVKEDYYRRVFVNEYNIGIEPPSVDDCNICAKLNIKIKELKKTDPVSSELPFLERDLKLHLKKQQAAQDMMKSYTGNTDDSLEVIAVDLQQALPTPKLTCNAQYYKRKMWTYNFCVHSVKTGASTMYIWDEITGKRGSCEIASFISHYLENFVDEKVKSVIIFSDNCAGQNKNLNVVLSYIIFIHKGRFETIRHVFLMPGHSMMGCDRDFGHIKLKIMHCEVFSKEHYIHFIKNTRQRNKFRVIAVTREMIKDFSILLKMITKRQMLGSKFKDGKIFEISNNFKIGFQIYTVYNTSLPTSVQLQKGKSTQYNERKFNLSSVELPAKYLRPLQLTAEKQRDLQDLLNFVPMPYKAALQQAIRDVGEVVSIDEPDTDDDNVDFD